MFGALQFFQLSLLPFEPIVCFSFCPPLPPLLNGLFHISTYLCSEVGELSTGGGKECIAVATLTEAEYFTSGGFDDILCTALFTTDKVER